MAEINFALLQPVDTGAQVQQGFATGMAMVKQVQAHNALRAYLAAPDDPQAYNALASLDPAAAATIQAQQFQRRKLLIDQQDRERETSLGQLYNRDPAGARQEAIAAGDFDLAKTFSGLDEDTQKRAAAFWEKAGPIAYKLKQTPDPAARQALWQQAKPILASEGIDSAQLNQFDPTNDAQLDAAITTSQKVSDLIAQGKIEWHQQGENPSFATDAMGHPVGTQNPAAAALPVVHDKATYDAIPPGTHYVDPEGHMRVKGGQSGGSSAGGFPHE
jgi:hypothetical protein